MPASPNQQLLTASVSHQVGLIRYANGVWTDLAGVLGAGDGDLLAYIVQRVSRLLNLTPIMQREQFAAVMQTIEQINTAIYAGAEDVMLKAMGRLIVYEELFQSKALSQASGTDVAVELATAQREAILHTPYVGRTIPQQFLDAAAARLRKLSQAVADSVTGGGKLQGVLDAMQGSEVGPGILERAQDWLHVLAQTDATGVADSTGREVYHASGIVRAELWCAILDTQTCPVCSANDGSTRKLGDAGWSNGYVGSYPPHNACRCVIVPMIAPGEPNKVTYAEWFAEIGRAHV